MTKKEDEHLAWFSFKMALKCGDKLFIHQDGPMLYQRIADLENKVEELELALCIKLEDKLERIKIK